MAGFRHAPAAAQSPVQCVRWQQRPATAPAGGVQADEHPDELPVTASDIAGAASLLAPSLRGVYSFQNYAPLRNTPRMDIIEILDKPFHHKVTVVNVGDDRWVISEMSATRPPRR